MPSLLDRAIGVDPEVRITIKADRTRRLMESQGPSTVNYAPPEGKRPDVVHTLQTTKESAHLYR